MKEALYLIFKRACKMATSVGYVCNCVVEESRFLFKYPCIKPDKRRVCTPVLFLFNTTITLLQIARNCTIKKPDFTAYFLSHFYMALRECLERRTPKSTKYRKLRHTLVFFFPFHHHSSWRSYCRLYCLLRPTFH